MSSSTFESPRTDRDGAAAGRLPIPPRSSGHGPAGPDPCPPHAVSPPAPRVAVGIDLGTTFSVIAHLDSAGRPWTIRNAEGDLTTPSVVLFDENSIVVGMEALKAAAFEPDQVAQFAKRDMGCPVYSRPINGQLLPPEVVQSFILEKVMLGRGGETGTNPEGRDHRPRLLQ